MPHRFTASRRPLLHCIPQLEVLEGRLCLSTLNPTPAAPDAATQAQVSQDYGRLPLSFEANQGQADPHANFLAHGQDYSLALAPTQAVLTLQPPAAASQTPAGDILTMQLVGGNASAKPVGQDLQPGIVNYLVGDDPSKWLTNVPTYGRVEYQGVYSGVDLVYHGNDRQRLEYDFIVAAGADPSVILLSFQGARSISLDGQGNLVLHTSGGDVVEQAPVVYQEVNGARQTVAGRYLLEPDGSVGFQVGPYDPSKALVIDPTYSLVYSSYLGGSSNDEGYGIAVDPSGDAYVTGFTTSSSFPITAGAEQTQYSASRKTSTSSDAFVTKLNPSGTGLVYSTYLGGGNATYGFGIAVDSSGDAYVTGRTNATNFPIKNGFQTTFGGDSYGDAFLSKLNPTGSALLYSSYLGGSGNENTVSGVSPVGGIAVDSSGNAYLTGLTHSSNFPTKNGLPTTAGGSGPVFVTRVNTNLSGSASLVYSTLLGGSGTTPQGYAAAIAIDDAGDAYVTGGMGSGLMTTPGAFSTTGSGAFVARLNTNLAGPSALTYSTYLDSNGGTQAYGIAVDSTGNAYVTGFDQSGTLPTTANAFQLTNAGGQDAFVTIVNPTGSGLLYSTYLGGASNDVGRGIAIDGTGRVYVTGSTASTNFPTLNAFQGTAGGLIGSSDAFVAELDPSQSGGASLVYSSYLGGNGNDYGYAIAVDSAGNAYVTGYTASTSFPTLNAFQSAFAGGSFDAFITKIDPPAATEPEVAPFSMTAASGAQSGTTAPPQLLAALSDDFGQVASRMEKMAHPSPEAIVLADVLFAGDLSLLTPRGALGLLPRWTV